MCTENLSQVHPTPQFTEFSHMFGGVRCTHRPEATKAVGISPWGAEWSGKGPLASGDLGSIHHWDMDRFLALCGSHLLYLSMRGANTS